MEFRVLGPLEVVEDGRPLVMPSGRQRALLAFLLIHANRIVAAERIVDELWGDGGPESGAKAVAFHVSKLRDALEPGRRRNKPNGILATDPAGYVLRVGPGQIDVARFERLSAEGRALLAGDPAAAAAHLSDALALWRGEAYADVAFESFAQPEIRRLEEVRLRALEDRIEADLALGRHAEAISELEGLVGANPLRERLRGQLMTALYRAGRQAEALRAFQDGRHLLSEELGIDPSPDLVKLEAWILQQDPRLDGPTPRRAVRNPYKGLRPFGEEDTGDFFGREALVARLVERLAIVARTGRFLAVVGPSGSGKSSAVRAGLVPALRGGALPGSDRWRMAFMQPGARPFRELAAALRAVGADGSAGLDEQLARKGGLAAAIASSLPGESPRLLLVIDQFEELFTLVEDEAERACFVAELVRTLSSGDGHLLVVATLRADFFDRPLVSSELGELVRTGTEVVTPLARGELERAVVRPAELVGAQLEPGLVTEVIADVARQPGQLPLLQYALTELFDRSDGRRLTREGYAAIGGVLGALGRRADDVYAGLEAGGRAIARQAFLRLVVPGEAGEPIARRVLRSELRALADDRRRVDNVLDDWRNRKLKINLVILNEQDTGYAMELHNQIYRQIAHMGADAWLNQSDGIFLLRSDQIPRDDRVLLETAAGVIFDQKKGNLAEHAQRRVAPKPRIGIVGEIFLRMHQDSNQDLIRVLEKYGAEVVNASMGEWLNYVSYDGLRQARRKLRLGLKLLRPSQVKSAIKEIFSCGITLLYQERIQKKVFKRAQRRIDIAADHPIGQMEKILKQSGVFSFDIPTEACLSIPGIIHCARDGCNGVVNVYPFMCMPSTTTSAVVRPLMHEWRFPLPGRPLRRELPAEPGGRHPHLHVSGRSAFSTAMKHNADRPDT